MLDIKIHVGVDQLFRDICQGNGPLVLITKLVAHACMPTHVCAYSVSRWHRPCPIDVYVPAAEI